MSYIDGRGLYLYRSVFNLKEFLLFMLFSLLECYSMYFLMFKVFKIDIFHKEIIFSSALMSGVSYVLRVDYGVAGWDVAFQITLMFLLVWMLFRIHIFYAIVMTITTYHAYATIQIGLYYILGFNKPNHMSIHVLQVISAATVCLIGWIVAKKRLGFDFIPDTPNYRLTLKTKDKVLFLLTIPALFLLTTTIYVSENLQKWMILLPVVHGFILIGYLFISYRKDRSE